MVYQQVLVGDFKYLFKNLAGSSKGLGKATHLRKWQRICTGQCPCHPDISQRGACVKAAHSRLFCSTFTTTQSCKTSGSGWRSATAGFRVGVQWRQENTTVTSALRAELRCRSGSALQPRKNGELNQRTGGYQLFLFAPPDRSLTGECEGHIIPLENYVLEWYLLPILLWQKMLNKVNPFYFVQTLS